MESLFEFAAGKSAALKHGDRWHLPPGTKGDVWPAAMEQGELVAGLLGRQHLSDEIFKSMMYEAFGTARRDEAQAAYEGVTAYESTGVCGGGSSRVQSGIPTFQLN